MGTRVATLPSRRRSRVWLAVAVAVGALVVAGVVAAWLDWRNTGSSATNAGAPAVSLPARTVEAGAVTVKLQPRRLDAGGAVSRSASIPTRSNSTRT